MANIFSLVRNVPSQLPSVYYEFNFQFSADIGMITYFSHYPRQWLSESIRRIAHTYSKINKTEEDDVEKKKTVEARIILFRYNRIHFRNRRMHNKIFLCAFPFIQKDYLISPIRTFPREICILLYGNVYFVR